MSVELATRCTCGRGYRQRIGERIACPCGVRIERPRCRRCRRPLILPDLKHTIEALFNPTSETLTLTLLPVCDLCYREDERLQDRLAAERAAAVAAEREEVEEQRRQWKPDPMDEAHGEALFEDRRRERLHAPAPVEPASIWRRLLELVRG